MTSQAKRGPFSADEDHEILHKYGRVQTVRLARQMKRQVTSVEKRAEVLFRGPPIKGPWTKRDVERLRFLFGAATIEQIAVILRRTSADVTAAAACLRSGPKTSKPLSGIELMEFKHMYGTRTDDALTVIFGRTADRIVETATLLCLSKDKAFVRRLGGGTAMPRWDAGSVELLRELYSMTSNHEIAQRLSRSVKSVVSKAHTLKLTKDHERLRQMGRENVAKRYKK